MQLWLEVEDSDTQCHIESSDFSSAVDIRFGDDITTDGKRLFDRDGNLIGAHFHIDDPDGQAAARSAVGSVNWLLVEFRDWTLIPLENLIADAGGTPTSIAVRLDDSKLIPGAAFALDVGVDAILLGDDEKLWQAAAICKAQRLERVDDRINRAETIEQGQLSAVMITSIEEGSTGDRACVDFVALLNQGEGILVGSSSSMMALVHGETIVSGYVPPRPFRVNAGAIHSYCMRADGKTCYLSEVSAGDELLVCNAAGETRPLTVGRVKIENRPLLLLKMKDENAHTASLCAQQAETVRLVSPSGLPVPVTELKANDYILARIDTIGRHVGAEISAKVVER